MTPGEAQTTQSLRPSTRRAVSIIMPTYREAGNIPATVERVHKVARDHDLDVELLIMDDDSKDGTEEAVAALNQAWVKLVVRKTNRGLSPAVLDGLRLASHERLVVMDADRSHPPEKIPELLDALDSGSDFVVGSRYVAGGSTDADWGLFRWLNSKVATLLARPFTSIKDPMSGFFALKRETFARADELSPIGYKIGLELLVKCRCRKMREIPIHFADRTIGESKLSMAEQFKYVRHILKLLAYKFGWARSAGKRAAGQLPG